MASLLVQGLSRDEVLERIKTENLFQFPTERMISSIANTCFKRIEALDSETLVYHLAKAPAEVAKQINLYKAFDGYGLYVFVDTTFIDENFKSFVQQTIDAVAEYQKNSRLKYDRLYLDQWYTMCVCDLENKKFAHLEISRDARGLIYSEVENICHD